MRLDCLVFSIQPGRVNKYGKETAEEWPISRTPPWVREKRAAELKVLIAQWEADTPPSCGEEDDSDGTNGARAQAGLPKPSATSEPSPDRVRPPTLSSSPCTLEGPRPCLRDTAEKATTPSDVLLVAASDSAASKTPPRGRKRRRDVGSEEEEEETPPKTRNICARPRPQRSRRVQPTLAQKPAEDIPSQHRASRRLLGILPEYGLLGEHTAHRNLLPQTSFIVHRV